MGRKSKGWILRDKEFCKDLSNNKSLDHLSETAKFISWNKNKIYIIFLTPQSDGDMIDGWPEATSIKHAHKSYAQNLASIKNRKEWTNPTLTPSRVRGVFGDAATKTLEDFKAVLSESEDDEWYKEHRKGLLAAGVL